MIGGGAENRGERSVEGRVGVDYKNYRDVQTRTRRRSARVGGGGTGGQGIRTE